jgi:hypothetical protein
MILPPAGTSLVTVDPAAMTAASPTVSGGTNRLPDPIIAPSPTVVAWRPCPSQLQKTTPAPMITSLPTSASPTKAHHVLADIGVADKGAVRDFHPGCKVASRRLDMRAEDAVVLDHAAVAQKAERPEQVPVTRREIA